jgi:hypothetical protein
VSATAAPVNAPNTAESGIALTETRPAVALTSQRKEEVATASSLHLRCPIGHQSGLHAYYTGLPDGSRS